MDKDIEDLRKRLIAEASRLESTGTEVSDLEWRLLRDPVVFEKIQRSLNSPTVEINLDELP